MGRKIPTNCLSGGNRIQGSEKKSWRRESGNWQQSISITKSLAGRLNLTEATDEGEMYAAYLLGCLYCEGEIEPNGQLAQRYLKLAATAMTQKHKSCWLVFIGGELIEEDLRQTFELARKQKCLVLMKVRSCLILL